MDVELISQEGPFVGCPVDAEAFEGILQELYGNMFVPGVKRKLYYWRKSYDPVSAKGAIGAS